MAGALRKHGLTVVETDGWQHRAYLGRDLIDIGGVLWHHTVASAWALARYDAPSLDVCINGRPGLPGPLCQIVLGRSGTVYLVAVGLANHAGRGKAAYIPRNMGNYYLIGVEMESTGVQPWDWTDAQLRVAPYLGAALETEYLMDKPPAQRLQIGHKAYAPGKIDPAGWPGDMAGLRESINSILNGTGWQSDNVTPIEEKEWFEMPLDNQAKNEIRDIVREVTERDVKVPSNQGSAESRKKNPSWERENALQNMWAASNAAQHNSAAILELVKEIASHPDGLSAKQVEAAVERGMTKALEENAVDVTIQGNIQ